MYLAKRIQAQSTPFGGGRAKAFRGPGVSPGHFEKIDFQKAILMGFQLSFKGH